MNGKQLRNSILQWAISGKLVPQCPGDEPASALLHRINPEAVPITEEVPFPIPDNWCWCKVGDISNSYIGLTYKPSEVSPNGVIVLRSSNIKDGHLSLNDFVRVKTNIPDKLFVENNDILICARNGSKRLVGKSALIKDIEEPMTFGAFMAICKTQLYKFVYVYLQSDCFFSQLRDVSSTTTINQLTQKNLNNFLIPLPPLAEQERIVKKVEELLPLVERYDKAQTELDRLNASLKGKLRASVLQEAIAGRLVPQDLNDEPAIDLLKRSNPKFTPQTTDEPLPTGWTACTMSTLCELTEGEKIKGKEMVNLDVKYLRGQYEGMTLREGRTIPANSLLILVDGENSGEVFRTPIEGYQGSTFKRLVINDNVYEPFVLYVINSHRTMLRKNKRGAAIPHLDKKLFNDLTVLVPPLAEQERIVGKVEELFAVLDALPQ